MKLIKELKYYEEIDFIKAIAISFVILLHSIGTLDNYLMCKLSFHIRQAMPIFMIIAGVSSSLSYMRTGKFNLKSKLMRLILPYTFIWVPSFILFNNDSWTFSNLVFYYFKGVGPGGYFFFMFLQYTLLFPLIWYCFNWVEKRSKWILTSLFMVSVFSLFMCVILYTFNHTHYYFNIHFSEWYSWSPLRFLFAVFLGIYLVKYKISKKMLMFTVPISMVFICVLMCIPGLDEIKNYLYPLFIWDTQLPLTYFYVLLLVVLLWKAYSKIKPIAKHFLIIGKASYHIYLIQGVYFMLWTYKLNHKYIVNLIICVLVGCLFYKMQKVLKK